MGTLNMKQAAAQLGATPREVRTAARTLGVLEERPGVALVESQDLPRIEEEFHRRRRELGIESPVFVAPGPRSPRPPRDPGGDIVRRRRFKRIEHLIPPFTAPGTGADPAELDAPRE